MSAGHSPPDVTRPLHRAGIDAPVVSLASLPTPFSRVQAGAFSLWLKDDGLASPLYGGNKVRKLEYALAEVLQAGRQRVITIGAVGSNHCVATALHASRLGLEVELIQFPQPPTAHVAVNVSTALAAATTCTCLPHPALLPFWVGARRIAAALSGGSTAYIPGGGSSVTGSLGFVNAGLEFAEQWRSAGSGERPVIYVAAGTCGTLAGLIHGLRLARLPAHVIGVRVVDRIVTHVGVVSRLLRLLEQRVPVPHQPSAAASDLVSWELRDDQFGAGYGIATPAGDAATGVARAAGVGLEPTYTAKTFAALLSDLEAQRVSPAGAVYWHTLNAAPLAPTAPRRIPPAYARYVALLPPVQPQIPHAP
jgi:1-aminocyclopropane-1-carboxylate deaminase/D-cysteine desulfhydrase-like pyridoxal-dependent ACC family enzyme